MRPSPLTFAASALLISCAYAGTPAVVADHDESPVAVSLEARTRGEWRENNFDFDSQTRSLTDDTWLLTRLRLGVDWQVMPGLRFFAQGQDTREFFSDRPNELGQLGAEGDDAMDVRQAYLEIGDPKHFSATIGRQTLVYGDKRLISSGEWGNASRTFDAVRLRYQSKDWWLDAFTSSVVSLRDGQLNQSDWLDDADERGAFFSGLYFSTTRLPVQTTDFYVLQLHENDQGGSDFVSVGTRMKGDPKKLQGWDYNAEMIGQTGTRRGKDLRAFAGTWSVGYNWLEAAWKPRLGLQYDYASGDSNAKDDETGTFQNLFPTNHLYYGYMDLFAWQNLHNPSLRFSVEPSRQLKLMLDYHAFWLADTGDAWYRANQTTQVRPITPGASSDAGSELDFTLQWQAHEHLAVQAGYSHFFAGDYLDDTGAADDADFAYVMITLTY